MDYLLCGIIINIDQEDLKIIERYSWYLDKYKLEKRGYYRFKNKNNEYLSRLVMGVGKGDKRIVDHIDGNTKNNLKKNLRLCNSNQNKWNTKKHKDNKSGIKGIYEQFPGKWHAQITVFNKVIYLGLYSSIKLAKEAYDKASELYHREYGRKE
jgi:hypothetical protein